MHEDPVGGRLHHVEAEEERGQLANARRRCRPPTPPSRCGPGAARRGRGPTRSPTTPAAGRPVARARVAIGRDDVAEPQPGAAPQLGQRADRGRHRRRPASTCRWPAARTTRPTPRRGRRRRRACPSGLFGLERQRGRAGLDALRDGVRRGRTRAAPPSPTGCSAATRAMASAAPLVSRQAVGVDADGVGQQRRGVGPLGVVGVAGQGVEVVGRQHGDVGRQRVEAGRQVEDAWRDRRPAPGPTDTTSPPWAPR